MSGKLESIVFWTAARAVLPLTNPSCNKEGGLILGKHCFQHFTFQNLFKSVFILMLLLKLHFKKYSKIFVLIFFR